MHVHGVSLLDPQQVRWIARRAFTVLAWIVALFATYSWLTFTLTQFPHTRPWGEHMEGNLFGLAGDIGLSMVRAIPGLLVVLVILLIARVIIRIAKLFFDRVERGSVTMGGLDEDTAAPTRSIFQIIVWAIAIALAFPYLPGADTEAFKGISVLFGLMISIGASGIVGQAASGFILMYTRAFRAGEYVRIGDIEGTVVGLGSFATRIRTGLGEEVLMPNSVAMQNTTRNYSRAVAGTGLCRQYRRHHRLLDALATGARHARGSRAAHDRHCKGSRAVRAPDSALGFLRRVPADRLRADRAARAAYRYDEPAPRQHSGRVQRARRADHVAALHDGSG
jgi:hypothetical protein